MENADPEQAAEFLAALRHKSDVEIVASPLVATSRAMVDGKVQLLPNFSGLRGGVNPVPTVQKGIALRMRTGATRVEFLPFLGEVQVIRGERDGDQFAYRLPELGRGIDQEV